MKKPQIFEIRNKSKIAPQMSILEMVTTPIFATIFNSGNPETSSPPPPSSKSWQRVWSQWLSSTKKKPKCTISNISHNSWSIPDYIRLRWVHSGCPMAAWNDYQTDPLTAWKRALQRSALICGHWMTSMSFSMVQCAIISRCKWCDMYSRTSVKATRELDFPCPPCLGLQGRSP